MRKIILLTLLFTGTIFPVASQLFTYGVQTGLNYSHYGISEKNSAIEITKGSIGFHTGFFFRRDFDNFFVGADINYSSTLGGTIYDNTSTFDLRSGSVNMPLLFGKKFYPGIRLYVGSTPTVFIKHNDNEFKAFLDNSPATQSSVDGDLFRNEFIFYIMAGTGFEFSKFFVEFRYEHPLDFFIREDFSTGGTTTTVDNYHYIYQIIFTLGYRFN